jgi:hypothetical protein
MREYFFCKPANLDSIDEQWSDCLDQLVKIRDSGWLLLKAVIFINTADIHDFIRKRREIGDSIKDRFREHCPAYNVVSQPPLSGSGILAEVLAIKVNSGRCIYKLHESVPYVAIESACGVEVFAAGLGDGLESCNTRESSLMAFRQMMSILKVEGMTLDNVIRQWNYVGDILHLKNDFQNYQVFNEVRSDFYEKYRIVRSFPAATGVGSLYGGFFLDFHAIRPGSGTRILPLNNPDQTNAFEYDHEVLVGQDSEGGNAKKPPKFERAVIMTCTEETLLYVSGTASIKGQVTVGIDDVARQTKVTIDNIANMADVVRIRELTGRQDLSSLKLISHRVYIKDRGDYEAVKEACGDNYPVSSGSFVEADICRNELLVEIEAEFIAISS